MLRKGDRLQLLKKEGPKRYILTAYYGAIQVHHSEGSQTSHLDCLTDMARTSHPASSWKRAPAN